MIKKVILFVSTDIEDLDNCSLDRIFQEDIVDYEITDLTKEEREEFD
jgi:hypothetical protein